MSREGKPKTRERTFTIAGWIALGLAASIMWLIPYEYTVGSQTIVVHFLDTQEEIDKACGKAEKKGFTKLGCVKDNGQIYVSNPCNWPEAKDDTYARLMCHEKAHVQGWRHPPNK